MNTPSAKAECAVPYKRLLAYFSQRLDPSEQSVLERHLLDCEGCASRAWAAHRFCEYWESWTPRAHGESYRREALEAGLHRALSTPVKPALEARLTAWLRRVHAGQESPPARPPTRTRQPVAATLERIAGRAREQAAAWGQLLPVAVEMLSSALSGEPAPTALAPVPVVRGGRVKSPKTPARPPSPARPRSGAATLAPVPLVRNRFRLEVPGPRPEGVPTRGERTRLALLIPVRTGLAPRLEELTWDGAAGRWVGELAGIKPGDYLCALEPPTPQT